MGQAVKANFGRSEILTVVAGGTTWSIVVTTPCITLSYFNQIQYFIHYWNPLCTAHQLILLACNDHLPVREVTSFECTSIGIPQATKKSVKTMCAFYK